MLEGYRCPAGSVGTRVGPLSEQPGWASGRGWRSQEPALGGTQGIQVNRKDSLVNPAIEGLLETAESKFRLVTVSAKRGRQINSYFGQLGEGLGSSIPPQVTSTSRKPLSIAFEELAAGKIQPVEPPEEVEEIDAMLDAIDADLAEQAADDLPSGEARVEGEEGA